MGYQMLGVDLNINQNETHMDLYLSNQETTTQANLNPWET